MPKSVSLTRPSSATSTLPGLTSRWVIPLRCAARSAPAVANPTTAACAVGQRALLGDHRGEVARRHHLQHDHRLAVGVDDVEDSDDVGVRQAAERARLAHDPLAHRQASCCGHARRDLELLDRDPALQHLVVAGPHGAHRAAAELARTAGSARRSGAAGRPPDARGHCRQPRRPRCRRPRREPPSRTGTADAGCDGCVLRCIRRVRGVPCSVLMSRWMAGGVVDKIGAVPCIGQCDERRKIPLVVARADRSSSRAGPSAADRQPLGERFGLVGHSAWYTAVRVRSMG